MRIRFGKFQGRWFEDKEMEVFLGEERCAVVTQYMDKTVFAYLVTFYTEALYEEEIEVRVRNHANARSALAEAKNVVRRSLEVTP